METPNSPSPEPPAARCALKIFGTGSAGVALLAQLRAGELLPAEFVAVDSSALGGEGGIERIEIGKNLLGGHGSHRAEPGRVEQEAQLNAVKEASANCDVVLVLAGLGGRTGSWMSAAVSRAAKEAGAKVFAFVTLPFDCEGSVRFSQARMALERLKPCCDFMFVQPHQDFCDSHSESLSLAEVYAPSNRRVLATVRHVVAAMNGTSMMGMEFTDLCMMLRDRGSQVIFAVASNGGENRAGAVTEELLAHPQMAGGRRLAEAETVAVSLAGPQDLRMADVNKVMSELGNHWQGTSHLLSASVSGTAQGPLSVLLLVVTQDAAQNASRLSAPMSGSREASDSSAFATDHLTDDTKSTPRFSPAARVDRPPSGPRIRGSRTRTHSPRLRQAQLELDMINKGRFEKSEPTIHKGEDLDVPTFIRRGVVLN